MIPGVDGAGRLADGRRVFFFMPRPPLGSMADKTVVPQGMWTPLPDAIDDVTAAAIGNPGVSSWAALTERTHFQPGQTVLVNGATGISGQLAVQVAQHLGAGKVIATGRNPDVLERLRKQGAEVIPLVDDDDALEDSFGPVFAQGVDVVLDYLWGRSARVALIAAARAGKEGLATRFVSIGSVSGPDLVLPSAVLRSSLIELVGSGLGGVPMDRLVASIAAFFEAAASARFSIATRPIPLAQIADVWADDERGHRTVLLPGMAGA
jgi:NADPH:quinone reductase-like Zn-dependent oxidoreductase